MFVDFLGIILPLESPHGNRGNGVGFEALPAQIILGPCSGTSERSSQAKSWKVQGWENRESELLGIISTGIGMTSLEFGFSVGLCRGRAGPGSDPGFSLDLSRGFPVSRGRSEDSRGF